MELRYSSAFWITDQYFEQLIDLISNIVSKAAHQLMSLSAQ
jgi:hypothetical protein